MMIEVGLGLGDGSDASLPFENFFCYFSVLIR